MKKSLIALAVLAAAGAASAQSSVTLYGMVDAYAGSIKDTLSTTSTKINDNTSVIGSGGLKTNRFGLKGSEDLGGGLKANFVLESGFSIDSGNQSVAGNQFNREASVGLSGNFGSIKAGRMLNAYDSLRGDFNNSANLNIAVTRDAIKALKGTDTIGDYTDFQSNVVRFDSAVYNGFSGSVSYSAGEKAATPNPNAAGLYLKYANGPLAVGYAFDREYSSTGVKNKLNQVGASYDFGVAKLVGSYQTVKADTGAKDENKSYQLGVSAPVAGVNLYAGYLNGKLENAAGVEVRKVTGYDLAASYPLSKRTDAYVGYESVKQKLDQTGEKKLFAAGVRHVF